MTSIARESRIWSAAASRPARLLPHRFREKIDRLERQSVPSKTTLSGIGSLWWSAVTSKLLSLLGPVGTAVYQQLPQEETCRVQLPPSRDLKLRLGACSALSTFASPQSRLLWASCHLSPLITLLVGLGVGKQVHHYSIHSDYTHTKGG